MYNVRCRFVSHLLKHSENFYMLTPSHTHIHTCALCRMRICVYVQSTQFWKDHCVSGRLLAHKSNHKQYLYYIIVIWKHTSMGQKVLFMIKTLSVITTWACAFWRRVYRINVKCGLFYSMRHKYITNMI